MEFDWLEEQLSAAVRARTFSGSFLITRGGRELLSFNGGLANREHNVTVTDRTRFGTASVTKMFTATAVMRLVERGILSTDDRLVDLLPEDMRPVGADDRITVHDLLTHTSGIADYYDEVALGPAAFALLWEDIPVSRMRSPRDFVPLFRDLPARREPGGRVGHYCSAEYVLLGLILEEVTDRPFVDAIEEEIFAVAEMEDSAFLPLDDVDADVATGYIRPEASGPWTTNIYSIPVVGGPDGGAYCTARDLDRFLRALSDGTLVSQDTLKLMTSAQSTLEAFGIDQGYGLLIEGSGPRFSFGHDGEDPGFSARAFRYPELDLNWVALANEIEAATPFSRVLRRRLEGDEQG